MICNYSDPSPQNLFERQTLAWEFVPDFSSNRTNFLILFDKLAHRGACCHSSFRPYTVSGTVTAVFCITVGVRQRCGYSPALDSPAPPYHYRPHADARLSLVQRRSSATLAFLKATADRHRLFHFPALHTYFICLNSILHIQDRFPWEYRKGQHGSKDSAESLKLSQPVAIQDKRLIQFPD